MECVHLAWRHRINDTRIVQRECQSLTDVCSDVTYITTGDSAEASSGVNIVLIDSPSGQKYKRYTHMLKETISASRKLDADIYHIHEPELIPIGILLKIDGKKIIYDAHEQTFHQKWDAEIPLWQKLPETVGAVSFEKAASLLFNGIVAATPTIKETFPDEKSVTVANFPKLENFIDFKDIPYSDRSNNIVYVGGLSKVRGIKEMIQAMSLLPDDLDVRLQLAGEFSTEALQENVATMDGWEKVDFHGWVSNERVFQLLSDSKVGLAPLHKVNRHKKSMPNKLFEYMAAGLPIIASDFETWEEFMKNPTCGRFVDPTNPHEIADQIQWLFENRTCAASIGKNAREVVKTQYNWESQEETLINLYRSI